MRAEAGRVSGDGENQVALADLKRIPAVPATHACPYHKGVASGSLPTELESHDRLANADSGLWRFRKEREESVGKRYDRSYENSVIAAELLFDS